jgi:O-antigen ligase
MKTATPPKKTQRASGALNSKGLPSHNLVQALIGIWIALAVTKFGNPVILDNLVTRPADVAELIFTPWPLAWGYAITLGVLIVSAALLRPAQWFHPVLAVVAAWLAWQFVSAIRTIQPDLTWSCLVHFSFLLVIFWFGFSCLARLTLNGFFWTPLLLGFAFMIWTGVEQHYGGLEATRRAVYEQPDWQSYPPEFMKKIATNRIFATLFYPNALAGVILFLGPVAGWKLWMLTGRWPRIVRSVTTGLFIFLSAACLYWTGSKGGWLIAIVLGGVVFLHSPLPRPWKVAGAILLLVIGLTGFFVKYAGYFKAGATSASARMDYWRAGAQTFLAHPAFGTGPGTFGPAYKAIKPPEAEMARLTHNDYLQQFSDSGTIGGLCFAAFVVLLLVGFYQKNAKLQLDLRLLLLGLFAYAVQSFIEFNLYIPALSWNFFLFGGYLLGRIQLDSRSSAA